MQRAVRTRVTAAVAIAFLAASIRRRAAPAAGAQPPAKPGYTFGTTSSVVLLDIVVRDKKGHPVRDLRPERGEGHRGRRRARPDDVPARRGASERRARRRPRCPSGLQPDPNRQVSLVTMVFDKLLDDRQLAKQAALDFIANNMQSTCGCRSSRSTSASRCARRSRRTRTREAGDSTRPRARRRWRPRRSSGRPRSRNSIPRSS